MLAVTVACLLPAGAARASAQGSPPDGSRVFYLLPITDGQPTAERVDGLLESLGRGGPYLRVGFSGLFRYLADVDPARDYQSVTTRFEEIAAVARQTGAPFLVHLNGGRWAGGGPLVESLAGDPKAMAWDRLNRPWTHLVDGEYFFSLSVYNERYRRYKKRNLKAAAAWLADFAAGPDGDLLVGVSTDSEVVVNLHPYYDYNPLVADELVDWLAGTGPYGPGGRWQAEGRGLSLRQMNGRYGTGYARWKEVGPPRENDGGPFWRDWTDFRVMLVHHTVQDQVDWLGQAGLPAERTFTHQSAVDPEVLGDALTTAQVSGGNLGVSLYAAQAVDVELLSRIKPLSRTWGVLEYRPDAPDPVTVLGALELLRSYAPRVLCPYHWDDLGGRNEVGFTIVGTPIEEALRTFVRLHGGEPLPD